MRRAAKQEIRLLQKLNHAHIISLLLPTARVGKTSGKSSSTNDGDGDIYQLNDAGTSWPGVYGLSV